MYAVSRLRISAAPWMALTPFQLRALWARFPVVETSTRMVPWQPASTIALEGSISTAKSASNSSGRTCETRYSPLRSASTSSHS